MQLQALIRAATDIFACPAFLIHAFYRIDSHPTDTDHNLDLDAINATFTALLKVHTKSLANLSLQSACTKRHQCLIFLPELHHLHSAHLLDCEQQRLGRPFQPHRHSLTCLESFNVRTSLMICQLANLQVKLHGQAILKPMPIHLLWQGGHAPLRVLASVHLGISITSDW